jgi:hypothetical protein
MKKLMTFLLIVGLTISLGACASDKIEANTFLSIEINPSLDLIINGELNVVSYAYMNEAAEIVGAGLEDFVGMNYEDALNLYLNAAVMTGYIDTDRNDNAVSIQACSASDETANEFQVQLETKLQTYFEENKLGAVVLNQGEVNEDILALVDTYDISVGFAKLVNTYANLDEANTVEVALEMTPSELIEAIGASEVTSMVQYRSQREDNAKEIKDELKNALQTKVEAHLQAVEDGTCVQPDMTGVKEAYLFDYEGVKAEFVARNQERVDYANAVMGGVVAQYLVGSYSFEKSSEELPYIVTYQNYELKNDGTYTESHSWASRESSQYVTSEDSGTWEVVDGVLILTNENNYTQQFQISSGRIVFENLDGIKVTFKKMTTK